MAIDHAAGDLSVHPVLADVISALSDAGYWASAYDTRWRIVAQTAELAVVSSPNLISGQFQFGRVALVGHGQTPELVQELVRQVGPWILADLNIDRSTLREMLHPELRDIVDDLGEAGSSAALATASPTMYLGDKIGTAGFLFRVRDSNGHVVGTVNIVKPGVGMNTIAMLTAAGDLDHLQRMHGLARASRRPAAVLFADLEGSAQLSKRMPTATYFTLVRRMTRAADECVIDQGGLVGRHIGDGVAAFFVAETEGSESLAARACVATARTLQAAMLQIAERHDLPAEDVTVRAGLHWGSTLYIGSIITLGRTEVTALGDEVNEAARMEACATGGRLLASKDLIERLDPADAQQLDIDPDRIQYTQLADLASATDKARRDAPAIPVCDIAEGP